ncbi:MAG: TIR domain-containing protein [Chloroflexi bacterium]|nr:MAG: TIR domain-containing protein [Chloroflexota bacterium]
MRIFVCHSNLDSKFVIQVASLLRSSCEDVYIYEDRQQANESFLVTIDDAMQKCDGLLVFVGSTFSDWQRREVAMGVKKQDLQDLKVCTVFIRQPDGQYPEETRGMGAFTSHPQLWLDPGINDAAGFAAWKIMQSFGMPLRPFDGLPFDPNLFSYEKDIIAFFTKMLSSPRPDNGSDRLREQNDEVKEKLLSGCPPEWPKVAYWGAERNAAAAGDDSYVVAAALSKYHKLEEACMIKNHLFFPEARSRQDFYFPVQGDDNDGILRIAILVAGGIAPGINAVIDGIVQRHWLDAKINHYDALIYGIKNGVSSITLRSKTFIRDEALVTLAPNEAALTAASESFKKGHQWIYSAAHAQEGGSIIGTSRVDELIKNKALLTGVVDALLGKGIKILYVIGGDGSMKLAHALWHSANTNPVDFTQEKKLSVVAIPKTMDNDILWVWQSFGFLSAVEKAREILSILDTEVKSNPRLCILQLFGSDSGFVVSHTVAASGSDQCDAALIPEVKFSMRGLAGYLKKRMCERKKNAPSAIVPSGFLVMSETAIPTDAICYVDEEKNTPQDLCSDWSFIKNRIQLSDEDLAKIARKINLSPEEKEAIYIFHRMRRKGQRIQGQTSDTLRSAGLKIVSRSLQELITPGDPELTMLPQPDWGKLRIVTNEPRHVLRSIAPACSDIIMGQRLGTLAAENAMAGYTDFMISQWLTEFVLVPLPLVVLGRKRIPMQGMFWKSVLAKTGQPADLDTIGELPEMVELLTQ